MSITPALTWWTILCTVVTTICLAYTWRVKGSVPARLAFWAGIVWGVMLLVAVGKWVYPA